MTASLIDLSAAKLEPIKKTVVTTEQLKAAQKVYADTFAEAVDLRFEQMQEMGKAVQSKIALAPGQQPPAMEIQMRLKFLDNTMNRLTDLIVACRTIIDYETNPAFLNRFPKMVANIDQAKEVIIANLEKKTEETTHEEALLIAGFRDLERFHRVLVMAEY
jgi:hypothetical protein